MIPEIDQRDFPSNFHQSFGVTGGIYTDYDESI